MIARVLFVCAQNICRSPLLSAAFLDAVGASTESGGVEWVVDSAGTHAQAGRRSCRVAAEIEPLVVAHRSAALDGAQLDDADLVIAASLTERAAVARLRPRARTRTFTLREALLLGEHVDGRVASVAEYVAALDARRGMLELPRRRTLPWRRDEQHPLDVVDVHQFGHRTHRRGLEKADADARRLAARLQRALTPPS